MKIPRDVLDNFIKAEKPDWCTANDFAVMTTLLHANLENGGVWLSAQTIAERSCVCERSTFYSLQKLKKKEWIRWDSGRRRQKSNNYEILDHNLPTYVPRPKLVVSKNALNFTDWYYRFFIKNCRHYRNKRERNCTRPIPRGWKKRWSVFIQKRIDLTDAETVARQINSFAQAFLEGKSDRFPRGPQCLPWPKPEKKKDHKPVPIAGSKNEPAATPVPSSSNPSLETSREHAPT